jgi:tRNA G37 N-methylase TrmD
MNEKTQQLLQQYAQRLAVCWMRMLENPETATQEAFNQYYQNWLNHPLYGTDNDRTVLEIMAAGDYQLVEQWLARLENPDGVGQIREE